ncbi:MAG: hypothetical protein JXQ23_09335, partial [Clostridia bacterium]|nr:hypothetical protein [Clostridia bacterium]
IRNRILFFDKYEITLKIIIQEAMINEELKKQIMKSIWPDVKKILEQLFSEAIIKKEIKEMSLSLLITSFLSLIISPVITSYINQDIHAKTRQNYILQHFEFFYQSIKTDGGELS